MLTFQQNIGGEGRGGEGWREGGFTPFQFRNWTFPRKGK